PRATTSPMTGIEIRPSERTRSFVESGSWLKTRTLRTSPSWMMTSLLLPPCAGRLSTQTYGPVPPQATDAASARTAKSARTSRRRLMSRPSYRHFSRSRSRTLALFRRGAAPHARHRGLDDRSRRDALREDAPRHDLRALAHDDRPVERRADAHVDERLEQRRPRLLRLRVVAEAQGHV